MQNNRIEKREIDEKIKNLQNIYLHFAEKMKEEGIPLFDDGRVDMDLFQESFKDKNAVLKDKETVNIKITSFEDSSNFGDIAELFVTIIFNKYAKENLLIFRSSIYDDIVNNVDIVIIDKRTLQPLCAIDVASSIVSGSFKNKQSVVRKKKGVTTIKYGITHSEGKVKLETLEKVPLFVLGFPLEEKMDLINSIDAENFKKDEFDLFKFFTMFINLQCQEHNFPLLFDDVT